MRLLVRPKKFSLSEELRECLELRMRFALSRFVGRIRDVVVRLEDLNGPKGGLDKRCQVVVSLTPRGKVSIEEIDADFPAAIARAADRAGRAVARTLERWRDARTSGPGMSPRLEN